MDVLQKEKRRLEAELEAVSRKTHDASGQLVLISQELLRKERCVAGGSVLGPPGPATSRLPSALASLHLTRASLLRRWARVAGVPRVTVLSSAELRGGLRVLPNTVLSPSRAYGEGEWLPHSLVFIAAFKLLKRIEDSEGACVCLFCVCHIRH